MKTSISILLVVAISAIDAGHLGGVLVGPGTHGTILQGPSAKTGLVGPDGSHISGVAAGGTVVAPPLPGGVVTGAVVPGHVVAAPAVVGVHAVVAPFLAPGSGHEGQYVPDYTEHLYDDGSYKGDYYEGHY